MESFGGREINPKDSKNHVAETGVPYQPPRNSFPESSRQVIYSERRTAVEAPEEVLRVFLPGLHL